MQVYKRRPLSMIKGLVLAVAAAAAAYIIAGIFLSSRAAVLFIAAAALLSLAYSAVFGENIRLELEAGELRYYQRDRLRGRFRLERCAVRSRIRTESGFPVTHDIDLYITDLEQEPAEEVHIDCSPLSRGQFDHLLAGIEAVTAPKAPKLRVKRRDATTEEEQSL